MRVTIRTIAEAAGVSVPTVSRVLNCPERVRPETRERVLHAVRSLNFYPNESARRLRWNDSRTIGAIFPQIRDFFFSEIYKGMYDAASAAGVNLLLYDAQSDGERLIAGFDSLKRRQCRGILFSSQHVSAELARAMADAKLPVVLVLTEGGGVPAFKVDEAGAAADAVAHLAARGHRAIAMISGPVEDPIAGLGRLNGYRRALRRLGLPARREWIAHGNFRFEHGYLAMRELLARRRAADGFTAVFAASDEMALGAMRCLHESGLRVPDDISVIGFDNVRAADMVTPKLTTVAQPFEDIGAQAVRRLLDPPGEGAAKERTQTVYLPHRIVERESVGPHPCDSS